MSGARESGPFSVGDVAAGRYNLKREIARGGSSVVYEATHVHLDTRVAFKSSLSSDPRPLLREGRALARARHPHVVPVLDAGLDEDRAYLALGMVEGRSLDSLLATRHSLPPATALAMLTQLAAAMDHAHANGVIHGDLQPSNLLVEPGDRGDRVVVIDFGLASVSAGAPGPRTERTDDYAAPEQRRGEPWSAATDVYAAAATFYECVAGEVPSAPGGAPGRAPAPLGRHVGPRSVALDAVLARALAHRPADRFASVGALAREIAGALGMDPGPLAVLRRDPPPTAAGREARRHVRAPYVTPVRVVRAAGKSPADGRSEDISEGGLLLILVGSTLSDGESVTVRFSLPQSGALVAVPATTKWVRGARAQAALGVEFSSLPAEAAADIRGFVGWMAA